MTNFLVALGILVVTLACLYAIERFFARRSSQRGWWTAPDTLFLLAVSSDLGFILIPLIVILLVVPAFAFLASVIVRQVFGNERANAMWITALLDQVAAIMLKLSRYRIVKPPQT